MRFSVDAWDPAYGTSVDSDEQLGSSAAAVEVDVELPAARWRPIPAPAGRVTPDAVHFVDGVRRVDAHVWIEGAPGAFKVTCTSGHSYRAAPVRGRYRFRRL